jgi:FlaA1/EpsC-like NDP-sugar epimerase
VVAAFLRALRVPLQVGIDVLAWAGALAAALVLRYQLDVAMLHTHGLAKAIVLAAGLQVGFGILLRLYRGRYRYGSFEEVLGLFGTVCLATGALFLADLHAFEARPVPLSVVLAGGVGALVGSAGSRYAWRLVLERVRRPRQAHTRLLVYGAGDGAQQVLDAMLRNRTSGYLPVGLLDDDPRKKKLRIRGVPVVGTRRDLAAAAAKRRADTLLIAIPSAGGSLIRQLSRLASDAGLHVKVLPPVGDLIDGHVGVGDIRDLDIDDLLGRRQLETDIDSIAGYLNGRRVLVTGAGGSIGSELCRQIARYGPAELIMLDRDESALHAVQLSVTGRALLDDDDTVLADIRDIEHVTRIFQERRPHVVFHAAALKHLPVLERFPGEAVKTNVWGTLAVLDAAAAAGVDRFVNISTDKAADPVSVLGYSKRIAERLTAHTAATSDGTFLSVRFGNVLGSRGSVLTAFAAQIAAGGPVTVTDPEVTRYFMTVQEAVQLVIQAGAIGRDGEVLVLDMGEPVRIDDVARRLVEESGRRVQIVYTGMRPGEKLHEDLFGDDELDCRPVHPLISNVDVPPLASVAALALDPWLERPEVVAAMRVLCDRRDETSVVLELDSR